MEFYGIMRHEKRHWHDVKKLQAEIQRVLADHNMHMKDFSHSLIDWSKTDQNTFFKRTENWKERIDELCLIYDAKRKQNSVVLIDVVYAVSPDYIKQHSEDEVMKYFQECYKYHIDEFCGGDESLMLSFVVHKDETSWHAHGCSVPLLYHETTNKRSGKVKKFYSLDAKKILGGPKDCSARQDRFYESVSKKFGLSRGEPKVKSRRRHKDQMDLHLESLRELERLSVERAARAMDEMDKALKLQREQKAISDEQIDVIKKARELAQSMKSVEAMLADEYGRLQQNFVFREWQILQERHPELAKIIHQENINAKNMEKKKAPKMHPLHNKDNER